MPKTTEIHIIQKPLIAMENKDNENPGIGIPLLRIE